MPADAVPRSRPEPALTKTLGTAGALSARFASTPPSGPPDGTSRRGRFRALGWPALVAGLTGTVLVLVSRRFYYGKDDLLEFVVARDHGLSWTTLSYNVFQHFGPYNRLLHLVVLSSGLAPAVGLVFVAVHVAAVLGCSLWLMTELRLGALRRVLALVLIGLSVALTETALWFDTSVHVLAALAVTLAVCAAHVRGVTTGRTRWHVVATVLFVLGQLVQERPVFALPLAVLVDLLLLWRQLPWRDRLRRLWAVRRPVLALTAAAAAIALALRLFVVGGTLHAVDWSAFGRTLLSAFSDYWLPSLVNAPRRVPAPVPVEVLLLLGALALGLALARLRRGNGGPILLVAGVFVLYYGFLKFSPILDGATVQQNAERLDYAVYVTVPSVIALVHLEGSPRLSMPALRAARRLAVVGVVVLAVAGVVTNNAYLERRWAQTTAARTYLDTVRAQTAQWSAPDVTLIPLHAPAAMATAWADTYGRHDQLLGLIVPGFHPQDLGDHPVVLDDTGVLRPALLEDVAAPVIATGGCGTPEQEKSLLLTFPQPVQGGPVFLVVDYRTGADLDARVLTVSHGRPELEAFPARLQRGRHTAVVPIDAARMESLAMAPVTAGRSFCAESARIVRPLVREPGSGWCRPVDRYGRPEARIRCP